MKVGRHLIAGVGLALLVLQAAPPRAGAELPVADLWHRENLSGDWGGARSWLAERGALPFASYQAGVFANVDGGRDKGARYEGFAEWGLDWDLERAAGWEGGLFHIQWISYHGGEPTERLVGSANVAAVSGYEAESSVRFYTIYLEQRFWEGALVARLGQLAADEDFYQSAWADHLHNASFGDFTTAGSGLDIPVYPVAAPGAVLEANLADGLFLLKAGVYTADAGDDKSSNWGFDWGFDDDAEAVFIVEAAVRPQPFGLPGQLKLGSLLSPGEQEDFEDEATAEGIYALHWVLDQTLWLDAEGEPRLGVFTRGFIVPQEDRARLRWAIDGGIVWRGPLPGRPQDIVALGASRIEVGDDFIQARGDELGIRRDHQAVIELIYRAQITPWLEIAPDFQYFIDPVLADDDAFVIGAFLRIDL